MAEGEHLSEQTRHLWLADKSTPLEGTAKHPQGRLFNPGGSYTGDPMRLHPSNWLKQGDTPAHSDVISWHGSEESALPREDVYEHRASDEGDFEGSDWNNPYYDDEGEENPDYVDYSVDSHDRPMTNYGSAVGMHFGSLKAVVDRDSKATPRPFVHPARIPEATMAPPPLVASPPTVLVARSPRVCTARVRPSSIKRPVRRPLIHAGVILLPTTPRRAPIWLSRARPSPIATTWRRRGLPRTGHFQRRRGRGRRT